MIYTILGLLALCNAVLCEDNIVRLYNTNDFVDFINSVNSGTTYKKTTVFLEDYLDFSNYAEAFSPIGKNKNNAFSGTFDGQSYALGNMKINATEGYAGLFGYTKGATIKNIIFSMTNVVNVISDGSDTVNDKLYIGGIVGYCEKVGGNCKIENSVNIANVTFYGKSNGNVYMGGVAGCINSRFASHIRNCANYGLVASYGDSKSITMGGIIGQYVGSSVTLTISNCIILGYIISTGNYDSWSIGGIIGHSEYCAVDNCANGAVFVTKYSKTSTCGSFCGSSMYTTFKNCYWDESTWGLASGTETIECASYNALLTLSKTIKIGSYSGDSLLEALNAGVSYYKLYEYANWAYSTGVFGMFFSVDDRSKLFNLTKQLFLLPGPSNDGPLAFDGWYADKDYTQPLTEFIFEKECTIYGRWGENTNKYTISFDTRGGSTNQSAITEQYHSTISLSGEVEREDCMLCWWENDYGDQVDWEFTVLAHNITLHAVWACQKIRTANDLVGMAKVVNFGTSFSTFTVTLENDIIFTDKESEQFEPIGKSSYMNFEGGFDGQGYSISNLKFKSVLGSSGIFGYSKGATIRNVVMDPTCSVTSTYGSASSSDEESFFGALMGYCEALNGNCTVENNVNMGSITFEGDTNNNIFIGGLIGYATTGQNYYVNVVNCVNYGTIGHTGNTGGYADIGGLLGGVTGGSKGVYITNSINFGSIHNDGSFAVLSLGGIVGYSSDNIRYENCVSVGEVISNSKESNNYVGAIAGEIYGDSTLKYCYWNNSIDYDYAGAYEPTIVPKVFSDFNPETFEFARVITVGEYTGKSLVNALNGYVEMNSNMNYSKWTLNKNKKEVTFKIANRTTSLMTINSPVILMPTLTDFNDESFHGWFVDTKYTKLFDSSEITDDMTLFGYMKKIVTPKDKEKKSNTTIVFLVIIIVVIVIAAIFVVFIKFRYKFKTQKVFHELMEPMLSDKPDNSIEFLDLYPGNYVTPTLKDALVHAGIEDVKAESISETCYRHANSLVESNTLPDGVTLDDAAAIALYTMDDNTLDKNPCMMINDALVRGGYEALEPVKDILYLVMRALRKMPVINKTLYCGVPHTVSNKNDSDDIDISDSLEDNAMFRQSSTMFGRGGESFEEDYLEGEETVWPAVSSTSSSVATTRRFLAKNSKSGKAEGTLFILENARGYNVQSCSMFPGEEEVVLEPERRFKVKSVVPGEGLTVIKMEMMKSPVVFTEMFGEVKDQ